MSDLAELKKDARRVAGRQRSEACALAPDAGARLASAVMAVADDLGLSLMAKTASIYFPMGSEIDTRPLAEALIAARHRTALPVVKAPRQPLLFRLWVPGDTLEDGGFGTSVPLADAAEVVPDVLFVPLLSFDDDGYRLGYGGGFYDRTLAALRANGTPVAVGVGYAAQRVDRVPRGPHDQRLDWIATEAGVVRTSNRAK